MPFLATTVVIFILPLASTYVFAADADNSPIAVAALQAKAEQAQPRDRCLLYAELVRQMTDLAGQQFNSGDSLRASETLKFVQQYAEKIHTGVADDSKKAKECRIPHAPHLLSPQGHPQRSFL